MLDSGLSELRFCFGYLNFGDSNLPFDFAQDREPVERLVELFRISANFIRSGEFRISGLSGLGCGSVKTLDRLNHLVLPLPH